MGKRILEMQTVQSNAIRIMCDVLKETLNDVNFVFDQSGLQVMAMDGSHVAFVYLQLHADRFETYYCKDKLHVGLNMMHLFKLIKTVTNSDTITLFIEDTRVHELGIQIENADKNSITVFHLKMLDIDENEMRIPEMVLDSVITMPSNDFQRMCRDMLNISDAIHITSCSETLKLSCDGDFARQETVIGKTTHGLSFSKHVENVEGTYSLKYINLFTKATNLSNTLDIFFKTSYPLMLKYDVANLGEIMFCLAPKVD